MSLAAARGCDAVLSGVRIDYLHAILASKVPLAVRFGNPVHQADVDFLLRRRSDRSLRLIGISQQQIRTIDGGTWSIVLNGVDTDLYRPLDGIPQGLAFLGRLVPQKGVATAIRVARRTGTPLRIGGIAPDKAFFEAEVRPHLGHGIEYLGELDARESRRLLAESAALLFPIRGREAFGLVMAEALACGTPVVALRAGPVPEVVRDGITGFVCDDEDQMVAAVARIGAISRPDCRDDAVRRFDLDRVVTDYLRVLGEVVESASSSLWDR